MQNQEWLQHKTAVVLDTRVLVKRCLDLEQEVQDWRQRCSTLEDESRRSQTQHQSQEHLVEFAQTELQRIKQQIQTHLRAVEHHTGSQERLRFLQTKACDEHTPPLELLRIHQLLDDEVRHLYPAEPQSISTASQPHPLQPNRMNAFRFV